MRTTLHYLAAIILLSIYGGQVCPLIDTLTIAQWGGMVAVSFIMLLAVRKWLIKRIVDAAPYHDQPGQQFKLELGLMTLFGFLLAAFNTVVLHFPILESGPKVVIGYVTFGFFIGLDLALKRERDNVAALMKSEEAPPENIRYTSLTRKFSLFALATVALVGIVLILAVVKDVYWLSEVDFRTEGMRAQLLIMAEISFILALLCLYTLNIIISYTRNIRLFFGTETTVLRQVSQGDLTPRVPPLTRDEFGEIAAHTNTMIDGLVERDRIKSIFGKAVSPTIANRLLEQEKNGLSLGGAMQNLVILFCDIRGFTTYSETHPPARVINDLNLWFTEAVAVIQAHDGIVDKFIGDGIMAVFGLDGETDACNKALLCAQEMQDRITRLGPSLCQPMEIGIGIHKGDVLAGIVGSPERLEFTVVGDVVNTASRIESMTRKLDATILASVDVMDSTKEQSAIDGWHDCGLVKLKGKTDAMHLFGLLRPKPD